MQPDTKGSRPGIRSQVLSRPSSRFGWAAAAGLAASIALLFLFTAVATQGPGEAPAWEGIAMVAILLGLLASFVVGLFAVIRKRERSWIVLLPIALMSLAIVNELLQGLLQLVGLGE